MTITSEPTEAISADASDLPAGWRLAKFGDVVRNVDINMRDPSEHGIERYLGLEHIDPESLHIKRWGLIEDGITFTRKFVPGQVLFGKRRAYQRKVAVAEFSGICSGDILVFEPANDDLIPELLPFVVQSEGFFQHALGTSAGSLSPRTRWRDLAEYEFALPPIDEQRRVAEILWAAEATTEGYATCYGKAEHTRRALLRESVLNGIGQYAFKESEVGQVPVTWQVVPIAMAGNVQLGRQRSPDYQTGNWTHPYLRVANVFDGYLDLSDVLQMDFDEKDFEKFHLLPGDILLNEGQSRELVGRSCIFRGEIEDCCFQNTLLRFRVSPSLLPEYAHAYFQVAFYTGVFAQAARQTTSIAHLGADRFANLSIPVPPIEEQQAIMQVISEMTRNCRALYLHQRRTRELKHTLLEHLLSPEGLHVVPGDADV